MKGKSFPGLTLFTPANLRRVSSLSLTGFAMIVMLASTAQKAYAHSLTITATASCSNGAAVISYNVVSWDTTANPEGANPQIEVLFDGAVVDTEAFVINSIPPNQFTGVMTAPQGTATVDVSAVAVGTWGDGFAPGQTSTTTVTIPTNCAPGIGRFTGGGKQVTVNDATGDPVAVTKGFEVDCDLHQPSNNLEVNWQDPAHQAHQFHMTAFLSAVCTLVKKPNPPTAPVNTIIGMGTGRFDGTDGYTVVFELIDNGEPGTSDEASFMVFETAHPSNVVLNTPLTFITGGNVQAHVDQH